MKFPLKMVPFQGTFVHLLGDIVTKMTVRFSNEKHEFSRKKSKSCSFSRQEAAGTPSQMRAPWDGNITRTLKLTANAPARKPGPKRKLNLPTIHFQVRFVRFREGIPIIYHKFKPNVGKYYIHGAHGLGKSATTETAGSLP